MKFFRPSFFIALLLGAGVLVVICFPRTTVCYRSTRDKPTNTTPWRDYLKVNKGIFGLFYDKPSYVVNSNIIYLQVRETTSIPIFLGVVKHKDKVWTPNELKSLSSNHPELEGIWPEPKTENLGVTWVLP